MFELSGVNYEEVLEQGDSILVRVIASSSYRGFELSGLYCTTINQFVIREINLFPSTSRAVHDDNNPSCEYRIDYSY